MSQGTKIAVWIVVAVVVIGGIWWWVASRNATSPAVQNGANAPAQTSANTTSPAPSANSNGSSGISATDDSNAALNQDLAGINTQMNGFSSDNNSINQGLNDQPVQQAQL